MIIPLFTMKLDTNAFALACGLLWALGALVLGLLAMNGYAQEIVALIGTGYLGYDATVLGAVIGAVWGFFDAFIGGWLLAALYNRLAK